MKQLLIQGMASLLAIFPLWGEGIDPTHAARIAANHLRQQQTLRAVPNLTLAHTEASPLRATTTDYYAFNIGDNQGYILIAGDDVAAPVLGWTTEGHFQADSLPVNLANHLQLLQREIAEGRQNPLRSTEWSSTATTESSVVLRTATWGQDIPYNLYTPVDKGINCLTGCLATAASIIMRYHKHPKQAQNGVNSYYGQAVEYTPFQWGYMSNQTPFLAFSQQQIASLMWQVGANSNLTYGTSETSGRLDSVLVALRENFDYSIEARMVIEQAYTVERWSQLIHQEIDANRPVLYSGQAMLNEEQYGHAFVIDGYQGNDYYHINWGWDGRENGFFRLHALEGAGLNYNSDQAMIIGIKPSSPTDHAMEELCYVEWTIQPTTDQSYQTELHLYNAGSCPFTGEMALAMISPTGEIHSLVSGSYSLDDLQPWTSITTYQVPIELTEPIPVGWSIRPVYRESAGRWKPITQGQDQAWGVVAEGIVQQATNNQPVPNTLPNVIRTSSGLTIETDQSVPYCIYNGQGQCVRSGQALAGRTSIVLSKGIYILTIGEKPIKVFI